MSAVWLAALTLWAAPERVLGYLPSALPEASGMAASIHQPGAVWLLNDGDHPARLYRLIPGNENVDCSLAVSGVKNRDWEALASFHHDGEAWLAIADVGDNDGIRSELRIIVVREPHECTSPLKPDRVVRFTLQGGSADIEAAAVDSRSLEMLLISKRTKPPKVYALPLAAVDGRKRAREVARLEYLRPPSQAAAAADPAMAPWLNQPTGATISSDGEQLAILTYEFVYLYRRQPDRPWAAVLSSPPSAVLEFQRLAQQEAITFLNARTLLITSENLPAPLLVLESGDD